MFFSVTTSAKDQASWGRPPGGFVDVGCGNGLLTHILLEEGYAGCGFDVRSRESWNHYPSETRDKLHIHTFDPIHLESDDEVHSEFIPAGAFIIANHADELTPWTAIISTICSASGYLSIPCCAWTFDTRFRREQDSPSVVVDTLDLRCGEEGKTSSYARYRSWLAAVSVQSGWKLECDTLRIPSTRNWAIIGRVLSLYRNTRH
jgi:tRNASer (uridine44-2'-O)-methyltransferase